MLELALKARAAGKELIVAGLRSCTPEDIKKYMAELNEQGIHCVHKTKNLRFNGVLHIYPTNNRRRYRK
jgi:hypothetical protein